MTSYQIHRVIGDGRHESELESEACTESRSRAPRSGAWRKLVLIIFNDLLGAPSRGSFASRLRRARCKRSVSWFMPTCDMPTSTPSMTRRLLDIRQSTRTQRDLRTEATQTAHQKTRTRVRLRAVYRRACSPAALILEGRNALQSHRELLAQRAHGERCVGRGLGRLLVG